MRLITKKDGSVVNAVVVKELFNGAVCFAQECLILTDTYNNEIRSMDVSEFIYGIANPRNIPKGELGGECNRTVCDNTHAIWFNHSTRKYYCTSCAKILNQENEKDAQRLFGHHLCTLSDKPLKIVT